MINILITEDDMALSNGIILALKNNDYLFSQVFDIHSAKKQIQGKAFDLIILDINLPDGSGLDLLKEIREISDVPVIVLTANDLETDIVSGLELGADDYITKPFSLMILRARVHARLRRVSQTVVSKEIKIADFIFNFDSMEFYKKGVSIELSKTEQKLLRILVENRGVTLQRADLLDRIWTNGEEYVFENALSVTIKRLRDKLEDTPSSPKYIKTVYGIGYLWVGK